MFERHGGGGGAGEKGYNRSAYNEATEGALEQENDALQSKPFFLYVYEMIVCHAVRLFAFCIHTAHTCSILCADLLGDKVSQLKYDTHTHTHTHTYTHTRIHTHTHAYTTHTTHTAHTAYTNTQTKHTHISHT